MSDNQNKEIEDKEINNFLKFLEVANQTIKEKGKIYEFECPLCGSKAECSRSIYNGHLFAKCKNCDMQIIE